MAATYDFSRVLENFGLANAARIPRITTTMSSSISVKPPRDRNGLPPWARKGAGWRRHDTHRNPTPKYWAPPPILQEPCLSLGIDPIASNTDTYDQGNAQYGGRLHMAFYQAAREPLLGEGPVDADHGDLDEIGGGALEWRVGRRALSEGADVEVAIAQLGNVAAAAEDGLDVAVLPGGGDSAIEPGADAREPGEVRADELLRFLLGDAELAGEGERPLTVDRAEIDRLGARAHLGRDLVLRHAEDDRRGLAMDVAPLLERLHERRVPREGGEQAQLDLRVVGRQQDRAGRRHERAADGLAARGPHGDVLEVRVGAREPAGCRAGLVEARMDAPGRRVHVARERVHVGGPELRQLAVLDQQLWHLVTHRGELFQHLEVGGRTGLGPLEDRELKLLEQQAAELGRRVEVEVRARRALDRPFQLDQLLAEGAGDLSEALPVDQHAVPFHLHEHAHEGDFDRLEQPQQLVLDELPLEPFAQQQDRFAVGGAVAGGVVERHRRERARRPPLAHQLSVRLERESQAVARQLVEGVGAASRVEHEAREHRVVGDTGELDPDAPQHQPVVLDVVARLRHARIL